MIYKLYRKRKISSNSKKVVKNKWRIIYSNNKKIKWKMKLRMKMNKKKIKYNKNNNYNRNQKGSIIKKGKKIMNRYQIQTR